MPTIVTVEAGFLLQPASERERAYLRFLAERGERSVPMEDAAYPLERDSDGGYVVLLPLRSFPAARRLSGVFYGLCERHEAAMKAREKVGAAVLPPDGPAGSSDGPGSGGGGAG